MKNAIPFETIKTFVDANIFNACQAGLLKTKFDLVRIDVLDSECKCSEEPIPGYTIKGSALGIPDEKISAWSFSVSAPCVDTYKEALMHMIGATTMLLQSIAEVYSIKNKQKPILTVIDGGKHS